MEKEKIGKKRIWLIGKPCCLNLNLRWWNIIRFWIFFVNTSKVICWWIDTRIIFVESLKYFLFWFLAFLSEDWFYLPLPTFLPKLLSKRCITVETQPWETFWLPSFEISQISSWNHISSFYDLNSVIDAHWVIHCTIKHFLERAFKAHSP